MSQHNGRRKRKWSASNQPQVSLWEPPTHNLWLDEYLNRPKIVPVGTTAFEPSDAHQEIMPCIQRYFMEAVNRFSEASQRIKDVWFNELKKRYQWDPEHEQTIRFIFEERAAKELGDNLTSIREGLKDGKPVPPWIPANIFADLCRVWEREEYLQLCEKRKLKRNSDSGNMVPALHTGGSMPITEQEQRLPSMQDLQAPTMVTPTPVLQVQHQLCDTNSEHIVSAKQTQAGNNMESNLSPVNQIKTKIVPIGTTAFEPSCANRGIMSCIQRHYKELKEPVNKFNEAPQRLKDVWFNEFKSLYQWDPEHEQTIHFIFEKRAARWLADRIRSIRKRLNKGNSVPWWISDQIRDIWKREEYLKKKCNKGTSPALHIGGSGSIPSTKHRRRLDTVNELQQTQPDVSKLALCPEATSDVKKGGYVVGFGSDSQHYFPEALQGKKPKVGSSTSCAPCEARIKELERVQDREEFKRLQDVFKTTAANLIRLASQISNANVARSGQGCVVGVHGIKTDDETQSPSHESVGES